MSARIKSEALADKAVRAPVRRWFLVPLRDSEIVEALHEPRPHPIPLPLGGGEGARRAGEGVVHGPNACEKRKGAFHEPGGARLRRALISLLWRHGSRFDVGCSSCQLAVVGGVMRVVKIEHEETLQVVFPAHPRSGAAGGTVGVVSGSDRESAGGKANP